MNIQEILLFGLFIIAFLNIWNKKNLRVLPGLYYLSCKA